MSSIASDDSFDGAHSQQSSSVHSQTSTLQYGHESFNTFRTKVESLCRTLWTDPTLEFKIERGPGGSYNRIIVITILKSHSPTASDHFILRIPRFDGARIDREIATLRFVRWYSGLPVPDVLASDSTTENVLQLPYVIQDRLQGVSLQKIFPNLSHQQKMWVARSIGTVLNELFNLISPVSGIIESPDPVKVDQSVMIFGQQHDSLFRRAYRGLWKSDLDAFVVRPFDNLVAFVVRPFDIKGPNDEPGAAKTLATKTKTRFPSEDVLQMLIEQFMRWKADWLDSYPEDGTMGSYYDRFSATAKEMQHLGLLENDSEFSLCHLDLAPRNILVKVTTEDSSSDVSLTGILDWDSAVFAPRVMSCTPPSWIWAWSDDESEDEAAANDVPPTTAAQELKSTFEDAVGRRFLRLCYEPHHRLARKLIRLAIFGMHSNEELKDADDLLAEWEKMSLKFGTVGIRDNLQQSLS
ncbi:MAG: hypothetical protein HETSPECPRED_000550 [Heterodermia speciosa]|uniref:Aminoglycoside phosphotransferase domain-containing protein n=1 Tax=Heterodermia speciosa TaxID=116794 RepID=A0A8H3GCK7_9LECA|nr:MAG: hypothetical protein HETSPECPRED_000550 [Heterodermia speciosa]